MKYKRIAKYRVTARSNILAEFISKKTADAFIKEAENKGYYIIEYKEL